MNKSYIFAIIIAALIGGWVFSGEMRGVNLMGADASSNTGEPANSSEAASENQEKQLTKIRMVALTAQSRVNELIVRGRTQAIRSVHVKSQTTGRVGQLPVPKGSIVKKGDPICIIEPEDRSARLQEANALLKQRKLEFKVAMELIKKGHRSETQAAAVEAAYVSAQTSVRKMQTEISHLQIRAPFDGVVEERPVEEGDLLQIGQVCAHVVDLNPMLVVGQVSEKEIASLKLGDIGHAVTATGIRVEGKVKFIGHTAEAETRTFRVELEIWNGDYILLDGMTAEIYIPKETVVAHLISPAVLTLDDQGNIGVRTVNDKNIVEFHRVKIVADQIEGIWVAGLPKQVNVITVGHEFVSAGQEVAPTVDIVEVRS